VSEGLVEENIKVKTKTAPMFIGAVFQKS